MTISTSEAQQRWTSYVGLIARQTPGLSKRVKFLLLGGDTARRRIVTGLVNRVRGSRTSEPNSKSQPLVGAPLPTDLSPQVRTDVLVVNIDSADITDSLNRANSLIATASADWLLLGLDIGDEVAAHRTGTAYLERSSQRADVVYGDSVEPHQQYRFRPYLITPISLLSWNEVGSFALVRRRAAAAVGALKVENGVAALHRLFLELVWRGHKFERVDGLYESFVRPTFDAVQLWETTITMVDDFMKAKELPLRAAKGLSDYTVTWTIDSERTAPQIDIIIPTRNRVDLLERCVNSIVQQTTYPNFSITIVDNDSDDPATLAYFQRSGLRVVPCPGAFNYSKVVNAGVAVSNAPLVLTLNNDTVITSSDWLDRLVACAVLPTVGIVGTRLVDQHGRHEHDGIAIAPWPYHLKVGRNTPTDDPFWTSSRSVAAVTGAVQLVSRELWNELGGMDESLAVTMNDVDLCLRAHDSGHDVVLCAATEIVHEERSSRGLLDPADDRIRFIQKWDVLGTYVDPYFPPALSLTGDRLSYAGE
jgi:GT2 family glycosyltransferase